MKVTGIIMNNQNSVVIDASVRISTSNESSHELIYDVNVEMYIGDIDVDNGDMVLIEVKHEEYETAKFKQNLNKKPFKILLGKDGTKYVRSGNIILPHREFFNLFGISYLSDEGIQVIKKKAFTFIM